MDGQPLKCVVDASVGIKLFVSEPLSERADALFAHLTNDYPAHLYVPDLFYVECANILWKYARRFGYPAGQATKNLEDLGALALRRVSEADLVHQGLEIGFEYGITVYDACYVALANLLNLPLVTADDALVRRLIGSSFNIQGLGDFPVPPLSTP